MSDADDDLLQKADEMRKKHRHLEAGNFLSKITNQDILDDDNKFCIKKAQIIGNAITLHKSNPTESNGWKKQSETHSKKLDSICYYKMEGKQMTIRLEAALPLSAVLKILVIMYEIDLWDTWMPKFSFPVKMGLTQTKVLSGASFSTLVGSAYLQLPIVSDREATFDVLISDCIETDGGICFVLKSIDDDNDRGGTIPPRKAEPIILDLDIFLSKISKGHRILKKSKVKYPDDEELFCFSFSGSLRPSINIFIRTFFPAIFSTLVSMAYDVGTGKYPHFDKAMAEKEVHQFARERLQYLLSQEFEE